MKYYLVLKINKLSSHEKAWRNLQCLLLKKEASLRKLHTVRFQAHDILEKTKLRNSKRSVVARAWEEGEMNRWAQRNFESNEIILHDNTMLDILFILLCWPTKLNLNFYRKKKQKNSILKKSKTYSSPSTGDKSHCQSQLVPFFMLTYVLLFNLK